jgi:SPP1 family predicted phage head-tail adaptor
MRAGELRHRVTITGANEVSDGHHGFTDAPIVIAKRVPASVETLSGRELETAQQIDPRSTHAVRLRYRTGVKAGQALTYHDGRVGDRPFEIVAPPQDVDERHRELNLLCREATT